MMLRIVAISRYVCFTSVLAHTSPWFRLLISAIQALQVAYYLIRSPAGYGNNLKPTESSSPRCPRPPPNPRRPHLAVLIPLVFLVFSLASSISSGEITTAAKAP